jgi:UDP-N-acetylglucosamine 4,6-dehydratase/5-epimerase
LAGAARCVLITGGTGSFGQALVDHLLATGGAQTIRVYSRDELKQYEMSKRLREDPRLRFLIGDVRDRERLARAMHGVDLVIHGAAMKQVPLCEYNPAEAVKTNVLGTQNVVECAIDARVQRTIALSTDKAVNPVNLYGATKLCAEKLFVHANAYAGADGGRFACVRYGNVVGSRGSVIPLFRSQKESGVLTLTDARMTRFWISLAQAVRFVLFAAEQASGGEVFIPKIPSMRIVDLARAIAPDALLKEIGIRPGEKLHEVLVTPEEARGAVEYPTHYVIGGRTPAPGGRPAPEELVYSSDRNTQWLTTERLAELVDRLEPGGD